MERISEEAQIPDRLELVPGSKYSTAFESLAKAFVDGDASVVKQVVADVGPAGFGSLREEVASYKGLDGEGVLHISAFNGHLDALKALHSTFGLDVNQIDDDGATVLHYALAGGRASVPFIIRLIRLGADPTVIDDEGSSLLHHASQTGNLMFLRYLVEQHHLDVRLRNDEGYAPLDLAAGEGHLTAVQFLIEDHGADPKERGPGGCCPLHWAVLADRPNVVTYLVRSEKVPVDYLVIPPANPSAADREEGHPGAEGSSGGGGQGTGPGGTISLAPSRAASFTAAAEGFTSLHLAAGLPQPSMCQLLLAVGADKDRADMEGDTALHRAIRMNQPEVVRYLLGERIFGIEARNKAGATPLCYAALCGSVECVRLILGFHPKVNAKDDHAHWTALHFASWWGHEEICRMLLRYRAAGTTFARHGTDANAIDLEGARPIHYAAMQGFTGIFKLLIEKGAYYSVCDRNGSSALHWASSAGQLAIVQILVERAMDVNQQDKTHRTPIFYAAKNGHVDVVRYLLTHGAEKSLQVRDTEGLLVFDAARDQPDVVAVVKAYLTAKEKEAEAPSPSNPHGRKSTSSDAPALNLGRTRSSVDRHAADRRTSQSVVGRPEAGQEYEFPPHRSPYASYASPPLQPQKSGQLACPLSGMDSRLRKSLQEPQDRRESREAPAQIRPRTPSSIDRAAPRTPSRAVSASRDALQAAAEPQELGKSPSPQSGSSPVLQVDTGNSNSKQVLRTLRNHNHDPPE